MKNRLKGLLAVVLSMAFVLTATPLAGFAASTAAIQNGSFTVNGASDPDAKLVEGDKLTGNTANGAFYVSINGVKDETAANYGSVSIKGYVEENSTSAESGNVYYEEYTVPAAPKGYKDGASVTVAAAADNIYSTSRGAWEKGNSVNLQYSPVEYTVSFDANGGEGTVNPVSAKYDIEATLPSGDGLSKAGSEFKGWCTTADGTGTVYAEGANVKNLADTDGAQVVLYAIWNQTDFTVTYYSENDKQYGDAQTYKVGDSIVPPEAPAAAEGYVFAGWILGEENGTVVPLPEKMPAENLKAYASWKLKDIKVTYVNDGNEVSSSTVPYGSDISATVPADPAKDGYTFAGWFDAEGNNVYSYKTVPSSDITFTAKWLRNGNVTYMVDENKTHEAYEVKEGDPVPVPETNPEKFGKKFAGWEPEIPETMPAEDLVFTAKWETDKEFVAVVVGGTVIAGGIIAAIAGGAGAAAIAGVSIIGGILAVIGVSSIINKNTTYTVTYKVDGEVYKTYKVKAGEKVPTPDDPAKEGYVFAGWEPDVPDTMPKEDLTFEAEWSKVDGNIPDTGSAAIGTAVFAAFALSAAAAIIFAKKKKEDK